MSGSKKSPGFKSKISGTITKLIPSTEAGQTITGGRLVEESLQLSSQLVPCTGPQDPFTCVLLNFGLFSGLSAS